jgi:hypothetical protein
MTSPESRSQQADQDGDPGFENVGENKRADADDESSNSDDYEPESVGEDEALDAQILPALKIPDDVGTGVAPALAGQLSMTFGALWR